MTIVGFNFTKMDIERKSSTDGKVSVSNNVGVIEINETDLSFGSQKQKAAKFIFEFTTKYEPNIGKIMLGGEILYLADADKVKKIVEDWKKDKRIEKDLLSQILNTVLSKCNIQAIVLSQDVNLPSPIPLPKVKMESEPAKKK